MNAGDFIAKLFDEIDKRNFAEAARLFHEHDIFKIEFRKPKSDSNGNYFKMFCDSNLYDHQINGWHVGEDAVAQLKKEIRKLKVQQIVVME